METGEEPEEIPLKLTTFPKINGVLGGGRLSSFLKLLKTANFEVMMAI